MMTKRILSLAAACALAFAGSAATDAEAAAGQPGVDRPLKVLMIGNSFSVCVLKQMPQIAADLGRKLDLCSLYIDKMDGGARKRQAGEVTIGAATDRIHLDVPARQTIESADGRIVIESDAGCAIVWNAWDNDRNIADMGEGNHVGYLCVERGEVAERTLTIPAGETCHSWMTLSL